MTRKAFSIHTLVFVSMLSTGVSLADELKPADSNTVDMCRDKKIADCAQKLIDLANILIKENQNLSKRIADDEAAFAKFKLIAAPRGSVVAFNSGTCPSGWSKFVPAIGRFIRGVDPEVGTGQDVDSEDGRRQIGTIQEDAFQGHTLGGVSDQKTELLLRWSPIRNVIHYPNGYSNEWTTGLWPDDTNQGFRPSIATIVSDRKNGLPRTASETRPKNVGLLYCEQKR
jgi:hypothetical protein